MENDKKDWKERQDALTEKVKEIIDYEKAKEGVLTLKTNGYIREIFTNYDVSKYAYYPGEFVFNKTNERMMYCIGLGKSPNMASEEAYWFVSEDSEVVFFVDVNIPKVISQELISAS